MTPVQASAPVKKEPAPVPRKPSTSATNAGMWPALRKTSTPASAIVDSTNAATAPTAAPASATAAAAGEASQEPTTPRSPVVEVVPLVREDSTPPAAETPVQHESLADAADAGMWQSEREVTKISRCVYRHTCRKAAKS